MQYVQKRKMFEPRMCMPLFLRLSGSRWGEAGGLDKLVVLVGLTGGLGLLFWGPKMGVFLILLKTTKVTKI